MRFQPTFPNLSNLSMHKCTPCGVATLDGELQRTHADISNDECEVCGVPLSELGDFPGGRQVAPHLPPLPPLSGAARRAISQGLFPVYTVYCGHGHAFHWTCVMNLMGRGRMDCPSCRMPPLGTLASSIERVAENIRVRLAEEANLDETGTLEQPPYAVIEEIDQHIRRWSDLPDLTTIPSETNASVLKFDMSTGRHVRTVMPDDTVLHYEGGVGEEHKVRMVMSDGMTVHYEGGDGVERKVRTRTPDGSMLHYEGDAGEEHKARMTMTDGMTVHYEGEAGAERKVRTRTPDGTETYYAGESGVEHIVRTVIPDGMVLYYEGEAGAEHVVSAETSDGTVLNWD